MKTIKKILLGKNKIQTKTFDTSLSKLENTFRRMQEEAGWDMSEKMFWGYYFLDHNLQNLECFSKKLHKEGYQVVEIRATGTNKLFLLHIEEHAVYSSISLLEQFHKLTEFADKNNIEIFDGWDVEKFNLNKGLME